MEQRLQPIHCMLNLSILFKLVVQLKTARTKSGVEYSTFDCCVTSLFVVHLQRYRWTPAHLHPCRQSRCRHYPSHWN